MKEKFKTFHLYTGAVSKYSALEKVIFAFLFIAIFITTIFLSIDAREKLTIESSQFGENLTEGVVGIPISINPLFAETQAEQDISSLVYSGLLKRDEKGEIVLDLAESWVDNLDGSHIFKIKKDAEFHNGVPITAEDVRFTLSTASNSRYYNLFTKINIVTSDTDDTETFTVFSDDVEDVLQFAQIGILPKHIWEKVNNENLSTYTGAGWDVGSGRYKIKDYLTTLEGRPTKLELEVHKNNYTKLPYIENITFNFYKTVDQLTNAYKNNEISTISGVSVLDIDSLITNGATILLGETDRNFALFFNTREESILEDVFLRGILASSIDRNILTEQIFTEFVTITDKHLPNEKYIPQPIEINPINETLDDLGWIFENEGDEIRKYKNTIPLTISIVFPESEELRAVAQVLANQWKQIGVQVFFEELPVESILSLETLEKYDVLLYGYSAIDVYDLISLWENGGFFANITGVSLPSDIEDIKDDENSDIDTDKDNVIYNRVKELLSQNILSVPLYSPKFIYLFSEGVGGVGELKSIVLPNGNGEYKIGKLGIVINPKDRFAGISNLLIKAK